MRKYAIILIGFLGVGFMACDEQAIAPDAMDNQAFEFAAGGGGEKDSTRQRPPKLTKVEIGDLSASITNYVSTNYAGFEIKRAGTDDSGNFIVGIASETEHKGLKFDATGSFIEELPKRKKGGQPELTPMEVDDLSTTIVSYISQNYSNGTILKAGSDTEGNVLVMLTVEDKKVGLLFNADGSFNKELALPNRKKRKD